MYKRILLAYDGTVEGRAALREGALLAMRCHAEIFLLSVVAENVGTRLAEGVDASAVVQQQSSYRAVLEDGVRRLTEAGFKPTAKLVTGEPAQQIGVYASQIKADLVVVGHRKQGILSRWWSGSTGGYLIDNIRCSLLIGRSLLSETEFEAEFAKARETTS
jgi:nucleotide-binding universal stress UspA family protein